jgi:N-acetylglucosaminyldiphosphoundecaprenol N-acetyl-beta-D-mannosaminyltransferase
MIDRGRHSILGVGINAVDYEAGTSFVISAAKEGRPITVTCSAVHGVMLAALDPEHRARLNSFDMIVPDGHPLRWALDWRYGVRLPDRVRGVDFMLALCERAAEDEVPIFLFGNRREILDRLARELKERFPSLVIAGMRPSAFREVTEEEKKILADEIRRSGARLVFAGLGCPRQEFWAYENRHLLSMPIVGIGSAFDSNAGALPVPPKWMLRNGLEWLFRFAQEPRRLWKRYLVLNPLYLLFIGSEILGLYRFDRGSDREPVATRVG